MFFGAEGAEKFFRPLNIAENFSDFAMIPERKKDFGTLIFRTKYDSVERRKKKRGILSVKRLKPDAVPSVWPNLPERFNKITKKGQLNSLRVKQEF